MGKRKSFIDNPAIAFISSAQEPEPAPAPEITERPSRSAAPDGYKLNPLYIEKRTKRLQLVLQPSLYEAAKATAAKQGISLNELCNRLLEEATKGDN